MTRLNNINIAKFWRHFASFFTTMWRVEGPVPSCWPEGGGGGGGSWTWQNVKLFCALPPGYCQFYFCSCLNLSGPAKIGRYSTAPLTLQDQLKNVLEPMYLIGLFCISGITKLFYCVQLLTWLSGTCFLSSPRWAKHVQSWIKTSSSSAPQINKSQETGWPEAKWQGDTGITLLR